MTHLFNRWALALAVLTASNIQTQAATFNVTNTNNLGAGSLRQAVLDSNAAAGSDVIVFDPATFNTARTIALATSITINPATGDTLTITGPGQDLLTVNGDAVGGRVRIFTVNTGDTVAISGMTLTRGGDGAIVTSGNLTVTNMTFTENTNGGGGAIEHGGASLTVVGCSFADNQATSGSATGIGGGAIYSSATGTVTTITDSTFTGNREIGGSGGGGAIRNRTGTVTITNSSFSGNTAVSGGGAIQNSDTMSISSSIFTDNSTTGSGGGISNNGGGELAITNTVVSQNSAARSGGGISYSPNSTTGTSLSVTNSTISNNTSNSDNVQPPFTSDDVGGGLFLNGTGAATISDSTINGNTAVGSGGNGGGIAVDQVLTMTNCTISGNTAGRDGAGIRTSGTSGAIVTITNSTIVNNRAVRDGGGVYRPSNNNPVNFRNTIVANNLDDGTAPNIFGVVTSQGYNLIEVTTGSSIGAGTSTDIIGVDPNLAPLQNNGGLTETHALQPGSPAIDKGLSFSSATDQRGIPRPFDNPGIANAAGGDSADIGAFEAGITPPALVVTNNADSGPGSLRDVLTEANSNGQADTITFDPVFFATPRTIVLASEIQINANGVNPGQLLFIEGPGADLLTVSGNNALRPFYIAQNASVEMSGMTIRDGNGVGSPEDTPTAGTPRSESANRTTAQAREAYGKLPLSFEANRGQAGELVNFLARGPGYTLALSPTEAAFALQKTDRGSRNEDHASARRSADDSLSETTQQPPTSEQQSAVLRMNLVGANEDATVTGADELEGKVNYLTGNDPAQWRTNVPTFGRVRYTGVYPGIDVVYYGNQRQLEYDFIVAPGADAGAIGLEFAGAESVELEATTGDLLVRVGGETVRQHSPVTYQEAEGGRRDVASRYVLTEDGRVGFEVGEYDNSAPLIIDPVLIYSTYLGGISNDAASGIAVDSAGNAYVTGTTFSNNFPTANPFQSLGTGETAFVTKFNAAGTALIYSTYLGGNSRDDGLNITVDSAGNAYVIGVTDSTDFPTANALQSTFGGGFFDTFVSKLNAAGSALVYSTYLGGSASDQGNSIAVDAAGSAYVTGRTFSANFPTANAYQSTFGGNHDTFITKVNAAGTALTYSTYLGGSDRDAGDGIAVDAAGNAYVAGYTFSTNFPTANALQSTPGSGYDACVTKLDAAGTTLIYSTYLGGSSSDDAHGIAVDTAGNAYIIGITGSTNFPTANAFQSTLGGGSVDAFVTKLNAGGSALIYSTYLGGNGFDFGEAIVVNAAGDAYVTGSTYSADFPTANAFQSTLGGQSDAFVTALDAGGTALIYSTYLGGSSFDFSNGIAVNSAGDVYVTGLSQSTDFPTANALQSTAGGVEDAFVAKIKDLGEPLRGGAIYNLGVLTLVNMVITANSATEGGGVYNSNSSNGSLMILGTTISGNTAETLGGGVYLQADANNLVTIENSTISGNMAADGGGIYREPTATLNVSLSSTTVASNTATNSGGGITGTMNARNTLVANNTDNGTAPDFAGTLNSQGFNLIENPTGTTFTGDATGNITGVDPNLGPLQNNGGPTLTHALLAGSLAVDKGASFGATTDQRGMPRPFDDAATSNAVGGDGSDIGAFESTPATTNSLRITSITKSGNSVTIRGVGVPSEVHRVQATDDLLVPFGATPIGSTPAADANGNFEFTTTTTLPRRFYRIIYP